MRFTRTFRGGFTLIELLIAVSIMSIVSGLTLAGMSRYTSNQRLITAENELISVFQIAKTNAQSQYKDSQCDDNHVQMYWYLEFLNSTQYQLANYCVIAGQQDPKWNFVKMYTLPSGVTFTTGYQVIYFSLNNINNGSVVFSKGSVQTVNITLTNGSLTKTITVYVDGRVIAN